MKKSSVLDSFALIAYLGRERGCESVRPLLHDAAASGVPLPMNEINLGEVYYLVAKERALQKAEECLHRPETLPIRVLANAFSQVLDAARLRAQFPVSYADALPSLPPSARMPVSSPVTRSSVP